jgi:hypothetical protein
VDFVAVNNFGDTREGGLAGPMGLFIILLMSIATVLLIRNMNKRLRRLPDSFDKVDASKRPTGDASTANHPEGEGAVDNPTAVDGNRSSSGLSGADQQVSDVEPADRPAGPDGGAARS